MLPPIDVGRSQGPRRSARSGGLLGPLGLAYNYALLNLVTGHNEIEDHVFENAGTRRRLPVPSHRPFLWRRFTLDEAGGRSPSQRERG
jgi:hypothetical protein